MTNSPPLPHPLLNQCLKKTIATLPIEVPVPPLQQQPQIHHPCPDAFLKKIISRWCNAIWPPMLLNCIRQKSVTSWRSAYPVEVLSLPFSEDACQRCRQRRREGLRSGDGPALCPMLAERYATSVPAADDQFVLRPPPPDPVVPPPPCPFPSSSPAAALPPKPQSPQPAPPPPPAQLSPIYGEWGDSATNNQNHNNNNAANEHSQPPRPARWRESGNPPATSAPQRANLLLQQLRTSAGDGGEESRQQGSRVVPSPFRGLTASAGSPASTHQQPQICVFLEHQGETKRSALPSNLRSVDQLKGLFLRSFAAGGLSPAQLQSPTVKVYIQKPNSPHGLFYELEQLGDLVDQSVLRLFEQSPPSPLPPPAATFCHRPPRVAVEPPIGECLSEPEMLDRSWNDSFTGPDSRPLRPASVLGNGGRHRRTAQGPTDPRDCWGGHSSDSSSCSAGAHYPKSGSSTPREEREETRRKVDSLERQLSSLCSLVHSALFPRHEILGTELAQFRAQILDSNIGGASGNGGSASLADSMTSTLSGINQVPNNMTNKNRQQSMGQVLSQLDTMRAELEALRRDAQRSARLGQEMIQRALHQARGLPEARGQMLGTMSGQANSGMRSSSSHLDRLASVQSALRTFEASLENTRSAVLNSTRRLKLDEVDELAARLGEIGREAVELKVEIPVLQREFESEMRQTVERLATEEQKLREKLPLVDACLRRCKTLANMMVTMKKLAIIQDEERPAAAAALPFQQQRRTIPVRHISLRHCPPPSMATVQQQQPNGGNCHPLDQILDELNANKGANEISASFTLRLGAQQKPVGGVW